jgi:hypothetical protein
MQEASYQRSTANSPAGGHIPWGWVVATALGLEVAMIISAFAWVAIYSHLINPGKELTYYQNYAQLASPIVSVVAGIPFWFFACRWVGRKAGSRAVAMSVWAWVILFAIELPLNFFVETTIYSWSMVALSHSTKLLAAYLGGRAALKHLS